uniref:ISXO2-like transposase domain-containing protein n=1 Tax=Trichuris muris TaxID=70415 RepID=A0A5S6QKE4_TRIMR
MTEREEQMGFSHMCATFFNNEKATVAFMQLKGIMHQQRRCVGPKDMVLDMHRPSARWRCLRKNCSKELPLRAGTCLEGKNLLVWKTLLFIRASSDKLTSCAFRKGNFGMNGKAAAEWNLTIREAAAEWMFKNRVVVGGPVLTVEVDESLFSKRKCNRGRVLPQAWVVNGVCRETGDCFLARVTDQSAVALISVITDNVAAGSTVITDEWRG